jgi:hypothetical protein
MRSYCAPPPAPGGVAMREPRVGIAWSPARLERREAYDEYMASPEWFARRALWVQEWRARTDTEPFCLACGSVWRELHDDLHHVTYVRLGAELFDDLMPLCRDCHGELHRVLESSVLWQRVGRVAASQRIVALLREGVLGQ